MSKEIVQTLFSINRRCLNDNIIDLCQKHRDMDKFHFRFLIHKKAKIQHDEFWLFVNWLILSMYDQYQLFVC